MALATPVLVRDCGCEVLGHYWVAAKPRCWRWKGRSHLPLASLSLRSVLGAPLPWDLSFHRSSSPLRKQTKTSWPKRQQTLWTISDCCVSPHRRAIHHSPPHCNVIRNQQRFPSSFGIPAKWCLHGWFPSIPQLSHFLLLSQKRRLSAL